MSIPFIIIGVLIVLFIISGFVTVNQGYVAVICYYSSGALKITANSRLTKVIVSDLSGKTLEVLQPVSNLITPAKLQPGAYIINLQFDQKTASQLLIVQ